MFRKGGEVGGGITSGVMRENYDEGTPKPSERIKAVLDEYSAPAIDPISQLLIQGGLRGMSQTGGGGTLGNLASKLLNNLHKIYLKTYLHKEKKKEI